MMSVMTVWDESDITRWAEDGDPESQAGETASPADEFDQRWPIDGPDDLRLSGDGIVFVPEEAVHA